MNKDQTCAAACNEPIQCFECDSSNIEKSWQRQTFQYGTGESAVDLHAEIPVFTCADCGFQFAGAEAEEARQEAISRHFGLLTPREIVSIRTKAGMTQMQFAECTRIGIASIKRWETGAVLQNAANDELIYLMSFPENIEHLRSRNHFGPLEVPSDAPVPERPLEHRSTGRFRPRRITVDLGLLEQAKQWTLRVQ